MVKVVSTGMMALFLAHLAGAGVEFLDPEDPDWGKIRIGNLRIDIWAGFLQPARLIARLASGEISREDIDPLEFLGRFISYKSAPAASVPRELWRGKTAVGEETTWYETLLRIPVPMVLEDVYDAWKDFPEREEERSVGAAAAVGGMVATGLNVSTYKDSETATRKKARKLWQRGDRPGAARLVQIHNANNRDNRISMESVRAPKKEGR